MTVLDKDVLLAIALAYIYGLQHLISVIGEPLRKRIRGSRRDTTDAEWELVFADEVWVFPRNRTWKQMVWSGMDVWKQALKEIPVATLWSRDGYFMLFHKAGCSARHLTELETLDDYFVDPINAEVLEEMRVPTDFTGLLAYAASILENDEHLHEQHTDASLYRGTSALPGPATASMYAATVSTVTRVTQPVPVSTSTRTRYRWRFRMTRRFPGGRLQPYP
jgi:hypothetical protein